MAWKLYRVEDTRHFNPAFLTKHKIKRAFTYYVFDDARGVHICDMSPSYELWLVSHDAEIEIDDDEPAREEAREAFDDACRDDEIVTYVYCRNVNLDGPNVRPAYEPDAKTFDDVRNDHVEGVDPSDKRAVAEAIYREQADELIEHYAADPPCW